MRPNRTALEPRTGFTHELGNLAGNEAMKWLGKGATPGRRRSAGAAEAQPATGGWDVWASAWEECHSTLVSYRGCSKMGYTQFRRVVLYQLHSTP
jgi:hypothetical protein